MSTFTIREVVDTLAPLYGPPESPRDFDPVSELIYTILSQNTSDRNSVRAYLRLRETFGTWEEVITGDTEQVAEAIRIGGLATLKAPRIKFVLKRIQDLRGSLDLFFLREMAMKEAKAWLTDLPGVGPKTAACVLIFSLGMPALPVDTHVYRVAKRLGLIAAGVNTVQSHDVLEGKVSPSEVLGFHLYLINHGRQVCKSKSPRCQECVLRDRCPSSYLRSRGGSL